VAEWCAMDGDQRRARLQTAQLYLVTGTRPGGRPLREVLAAALRGGVDLVQLREKSAPDDELLAAAEVARELCAESGALFILNDRPDLVERAEADGVHVGQDDASPAEARALIGDERVLGLSTHTPDQIAAAAGVDYLGVGPVHETPTKPGRAPVGLELVRHAAAHAAVPWFAIGGVSAETIGAVVAAGARRVAVVRAIADAEDPEAAARSLRRALDTVREPVGRGVA
jgi:thiamine-phosphate pyrophosphorylase